MPQSRRARAMKVAEGTHCLFCDAPLTDGGRWYFEIGQACSPVPLPPGREAFECRLCDVCNGLPDEERTRRLPTLLGGWLDWKMTAEERAQFARQLRERARADNEEGG